MDINNTAEFGKLIRDTRKSQSLTQAELALTCNVGVRFIVDLENGKQTAQIGKAIHVAKMLGIKISAGY